MAAETAEQVGSLHLSNALSSAGATFPNVTFGAGVAKA